jgi:hypothetical protein
VVATKLFHELIPSDGGGIVDGRFWYT